VTRNFGYKNFSFTLPAKPSHWLTFSLLSPLLIQLAWWLRVLKTLFMILIWISDKRWPNDQKRGTQGAQKVGKNQNAIQADLTSFAQLPEVLEHFRWFWQGVIGKIVVRDLYVGSINTFGKGFQNREYSVFLVFQWGFCPVGIPFYRSKR